MKQDSPEYCLLNSTHGIIFFGTPHRGMVVQNLIDVLVAGGHTPRLELLEQIKQKSKDLKNELRRFIDLCSGFKVLSVYEMEQTADVVVGSDGVWRLGEEYRMAVEDDSALLHLPSTIETPISADANHSNIVKFQTAEDETYKGVCEFLDGILKNVPVENSKRFRTSMAKSLTFCLADTVDSFRGEWTGRPADISGPHAPQQTFYRPGKYSRGTREHAATRSGSAQGFIERLRGSVNGSEGRREEEV